MLGPLALVPRVLELSESTRGSARLAIFDVCGPEVVELVPTPVFVPYAG